MSSSSSNEILPSISSGVDFLATGVGPAFSLANNLSIISAFRPVIDKSRSRQISLRAATVNEE